MRPAGIIFSGPKVTVHKAKVYNFLSRLTGKTFMEWYYFDAADNLLGKVQRADLMCHVTSIRLPSSQPWPISDEYSNFARAYAGHVTRFL